MTDDQGMTILLEVLFGNNVDCTDEVKQKVSALLSVIVAKPSVVVRQKELTPRQIKVLKLRFGIDDGKRRTFDEIGKILGVSRERVRQIEEKSLRILRCHFLPWLLSKSPETHIEAQQRGQTELSEG